MLIASQLVVTLLTNNYGGILRRKRLDEMVAVIKYIIGILVVTLVYLFVVQNSATAQAIKCAEAGVLKLIRRATASLVFFNRSWTQAQRFRMTEKSSLIQPQQFHSKVICSTGMKNCVGGVKHSVQKK